MNMQCYEGGGDFFTYPLNGAVSGVPYRTEEGEYLHVGLLCVGDWPKDMGLTLKPEPMGLDLPVDENITQHSSTQTRELTIGVGPWHFLHDIHIEALADLVEQIGIEVEYESGENSRHNFTFQDVPIKISLEQDSGREVMLQPTTGNIMLAALCLLVQQSRVTQC